MLLWLWYKLAALIRPLAWELPHAAGAAQKRQKKTKKKKCLASRTTSYPVYGTSLSQRQETNTTYQNVWDAMKIDGTYK